MESNNSFETYTKIALNFAAVFLYLICSTAVIYVLYKSGFSEGLASFMLLIWSVFGFVFIRKLGY